MRSTDIDGKQPTGEPALVLARDKLTKKRTNHAFYVTGALTEVDLGVGAVLHVHPALGVSKTASATSGKVEATTVEVAGV
jgi:hypothetical protein